MYLAHLTQLDGFTPGRYGIRFVRDQGANPLPFDREGHSLPKRKPYVKGCRLRAYFWVKYPPKSY
jgi:hypothetical protein